MRKYQYYDSNDDGQSDAYDNNWIAQTFTTESIHMISKVKLKLFRTGDPGQVVVSIKATSGGKPSGADLCQGTIEGTDITDSSPGEWYEITLGSGYTFEKDTMYAIVVRAPFGDASNKVSWRKDTGDATYSGGTQCTSSDSGIDWGIISGTDCMFEEWGVGEPSPTAVVWGLLPKSQIDAETVEEAISRIVDEHNYDEEAHLGEGQSLQSHKASEIIDHLVSSIVSDKIKDGEIWEKHRHSAQALKNLLAMWPEKAALFNKLVWTGETGENQARPLAFDGTYIYAGLNTSPAKVIKIDIETMATVDTWTGETGEDGCYGLAFDGTYIYAGLNTSPAKVIKIDIETMATVDTWTGSAGVNYCRVLLFDGTYIYAGLYLSPAKVVQIDIETMATVDTWTGSAGENYCYGLAFDGTYIYAGLNTSTAKVIKIDPSDMETDDTWTGDPGEDYCLDLIYDGNYIYAGLNTSPAMVVQIDPSDMSKNDLWAGTGSEDYCYSVIYDGTYIYAGLGLTPAKIVKIDSSTMDKISCYTFDTGEDYCLDMVFDGLYLYASLYCSPAKVLRKILRDTDETGT